MKCQPLTILFVVVATLLLAPIAGFSTLDSVGAQQSSSTIDLVAIDAVPQGNTATSLGEIDFCTRMEVGSIVKVDVVVDAIPEDRPIIGFGVQLLYNPQVTEVVGLDNGHLLAASGTYTPFEGLSEEVPDTDGKFGTAIIDVASNRPNLGDNMESGPGVLTRITLRAKAKGVSDLGLGSSLADDSYPTILDDQNEIIQVDHIGVAAIAVGQDCPSAPTGLVVTPLPDLDTLLQDFQRATPSAEATQPPDPQQENTPTPPESESEQEGTPTPSGADAQQKSAPDFRTPSIAATATAVGLSSETTGANTPSDDGDGGFPTVWVIVVVALTLVVAGIGVSYFVYQRRRPTG